MIEIESVKSQVRQRNYPSHWRVYHGLYNPGCLMFWEQGESDYIVILPQSIIKWNEYDINEFCHIYFCDVQRVELAQETQISGFDGDISSRTYYWLDFYSIEWGYYKMPIESHFGDPASVGKTIIAACNFYQHNGTLLP